MEQPTFSKPLRRLQLRSANIAYTDEGDGDPILCIHGSWDDHHSWGNVAFLLRKQYRVVTYDRRGHSASTAPPGQGHLRDDVTDALELMDKIGLTPAHIIGHSYGANVAIALAIQAPASTQSLFVLEPLLFALLKGNAELEYLREKASKLMKRTAKLIEEGDIEEAAKLFIEQVAFGENSWENLFDKTARTTILSNVDTWLDQFRDPERLAIDINALHNFPQPITLSTGTNTLPAYQEVVQQLITALPSLKVKKITNAGHGAHISHPADIASAIRAHIREVH